MRKHIKIMAKLLPGNKKVEITLLEQSHFVTDFADGHTDIEVTGASFTHGPVRLLSVVEGVGLRLREGHHNSRCATDEVQFRFWVESESRYLGSKAIIPITRYRPLKEAIKAYNSYNFKEK